MFFHRQFYYTPPGDMVGQSTRAAEEGHLGIFISHFTFFLLLCLPISAPQRSMASRFGNRFKNPHTRSHQHPHYSVLLCWLKDLWPLILVPFGFCWLGFLGFDMGNGGDLREFCWLWMENWRRRKWGLLLHFGSVINDCVLIWGKGEICWIFLGLQGHWLGLCWGFCNVFLLLGLLLPWLLLLASITSQLFGINWFLPFSSFGMISIDCISNWIFLKGYFGVLYDWWIFDWIRYFGNAAA